MKTLITLLGRTRRDASSGYQTVSYQLPDGSETQAAFLGWSLQRHLEPDRLVIIGTETSMWDHLLEGDLDLGDREEALRMEILSRAELGEPVPAELLKAAEPILSEACRCDVRLVTIRRGVDTEAQMSMFGALNELVAEGDELHLDCTHGFRHMPMLLLAGARFLSGLGRATVKGIHYGLLEEGSKRSPVCRLDSLMTIDQGVEALARFDISGDYEALVEFLEPVLPEELPASLLREAAFHERTLRIPQARKTLQRFSAFLREAELPFPQVLLRDPLLERFTWADQPTHHQRQLAAARIAIGRRDWQRAASLLYESTVNRVIQESNLGDPENPQVREQARKKLKDRIKDGLVDKRTGLLRRIRNSISHGARPVGSDAQTLLAHEEQLAEFFEAVADALS